MSSVIDFFGGMVGFLGGVVGFFASLFFTIGVACFAYWQGYRRGRGFPR